MGGRLCLGLLVVVCATAAIGDDYTVTSVADSGPGSLRQAITDASGHPGPDRVLFDPSLAGKIIKPVTPLPGLSDAGTDVNGDIGGDGRPDVALDGSRVPGNDWSVGLLVTGDDCTVRGLVIRRFPNYQVYAYEGARTAVLGCYINTSLDGTQPSVREDSSGILVGSRDRVGGPARGRRNVVCPGSGTGIWVYGEGVTVAHNLVGVKATGRGPFYDTPLGTGIAMGSG